MVPAKLAFQSFDALESPLQKFCIPALVDLDGDNCIQQEPVSFYGSFGKAEFGEGYGRAGCDDEDKSRPKIEAAMRPGLIRHLRHFQCHQRDRQGWGSPPNCWKNHAIYHTLFLRLSRDSRRQSQRKK